jgi:RNA polymerase sigma factor (sigma-70 family)
MPRHSDSKCFLEHLSNADIKLVQDVAQNVSKSLANTNPLSTEKELYGVAIEAALYALTAFDESRATSGPFAYVSWIAHRRTIDYMRRVHQNRRDRRRFSHVTHVGQWSDSPIDFDTSDGVWPSPSSDEPLSPVIDKAICSLPFRDRTIIIMYYRWGWTLKQIGSVLGLTEARISQLKTKALEHLKRTLPAIEADSSL